MSAGVVGCAGVVIGFRLDGPRGGQAVLPANPLPWCCMKPCGRPAVAGREATQRVDRTGGWVMALPGLHEVLVLLVVSMVVLVPVVTAVMPPPCWSGSGPRRRAARSRRPRASAGR